MFNSTDLMSLKKDTYLVNSIADSLLASISDITVSVACIQIEKDTFIEIGCYLYRASIAVMELKTTEYSPPNAVEILQSLSKSIDSAKETMERCEKGTKNIPNPEYRSIIAQLEDVIKHMGSSLSMIPSSTFKDQEYAEVAINSLSKEMQNVCFVIQTSPSKNLDRQTFSLKEQQKIELTRTETETETDLYSIKVDVSMDNPFLFDAPHIIRSTSSSSSSRVKQMSMNNSEKSLPQVSHFVEPLYETFFCPLTKKIMDEPVTIESGVTYEKKAISDWFEKKSNSEEIFCPVTSQKLVSRVFNINIALKCTIEQWKERNEVSRIKVDRAALSLASSEQMVFDAIKDLQVICQGKPRNKVQVLAAGMLPLITKTLEYKDRDVRFAALELIRQLADDDDDCKEMIADKLDFSLIIKLMSSSHQSLRHSSLMLLLELSRSKNLCDKIGLTPGAILMLITIKYKSSIDALASEKANETLKNLEQSPANVKLMAENGFLEPLLYSLIEGDVLNFMVAIQSFHTRATGFEETVYNIDQSAKKSAQFNIYIEILGNLNYNFAGNEEIKTEMASYLGEIVLGNDSREYVAERVSPALIKMVHAGNPLTRRAAFKALSQISSYQPNGKILIEAGIIQIMAQEMFARRIYDELVDSKIEAAAILANIFESGIDLENLQVNSHGHKMASDYVVYNIINMLKNSTPEELNINLIRILSCLAKNPKSMATIVSLAKETETSFTLIEFINNPYEELGVATIKLLIKLAPHMGHTLADRLCKTRGQPENLIQIPNDMNRITEKQAVSVKFLAELPHQNLTLNLALLFKNVVPPILQTISQIQRSGTRSSRYASTYLEGLVGILVRFTTTLYDPQILFLARIHNFTIVFIELLSKSSSDEVQRLSAIGLENLSSESINLSKPPQVKKDKSMKLFNLPKFLSFRSSRRKNIPVCPVHRGDCSSENTFCLVDAKAIDRLLACLDHENAEVVEAALSALCTLLDDKVDVDRSVKMLNSVNAIRHVLNVIKEHKREGIWQKSFWVIEKFLMKGGDQSASDISQDRLLPATLVSAFHHGDGNTRQIAEKILTHMNKMPRFTNSNYTM